MSYTSKLLHQPTRKKPTCHHQQVRFPSPCSPPFWPFFHRNSVLNHRFCTRHATSKTVFKNNSIFSILSTVNLWILACSGNGFFLFNMLIFVFFHCQFSVAAFVIHVLLRPVWKFAKRFQFEDGRLAGLSRSPYLDSFILLPSTIHFSMLWIFFTLCILGFHCYFFRSYTSRFDSYTPYLFQVINDFQLCLP